VVVATKVDKVAANALSLHLQDLRVGLGLPEEQPLCVSSVTGLNMRQLWTIILDACESKVEEFKENLENVQDFKKEDDCSDVRFATSIKYEENIEYDQGYDWVQNYGSNLNKDDGSSYGKYLGEDLSNNMCNMYDHDYKVKKEWTRDVSKDKTVKNKKVRERQKETTTLKSLKKIARDLERRGKV